MIFWLRLHKPSCCIKFWYQILQLAITEAAEMALINESANPIWSLCRPSPLIQHLPYISVPFTASSVNWKALILKVLGNGLNTIQTHFSYVCTVFIKADWCSRSTQELWRDLERPLWKFVSCHLICLVLWWLVNWDKYDISCLNSSLM